MVPDVPGYQPGSFLLTDRRRTLLATGISRLVTESDPDELSARVAKLLLEADTPVAVGALPFHSGTAPHVVLPVTATWSRPIAPHAAAAPTAPAAPTMPVVPVVPGKVDLRPAPEPAEYRTAVGTAVSALRAGALDKVVLARTLRMTTPHRVAMPALLANLAGGNRTGYTYAVDLPAPAGSRRTLAGATPEMLLSRTGTTVVAHPLAGSVPRDPDPEIDRRRGEALLASAKDFEEHRVVVRAVADALRPFCRTIDVPDRPTLTSTGAVWHLATRITGELVDLGISALRLACALHPTPAVCGTPFASARDMIAELEPFDRGFYGGAVGWCDADGDGEWVVAIRCAELVEPVEPAAAESAMTLYAGAGIMPASDPDLELDETTAKFRTMLGAMGIPASD